MLEFKLIGVWIKIECGRLFGFGGGGDTKSKRRLYAKNDDYYGSSVHGVTITTSELGN